LICLAANTRDRKEDNSVSDIVSERLRSSQGLQLLKSNEKKEGICKTFLGKEKASSGQMYWL